MKYTSLSFAIDPIFLGSYTSEQDVDMFVLNMVKNINKKFDINVQYDVKYIGNFYSIITNNDSYMQMIISEYIESNWHNTPINDTVLI